MRKWDVAHSLVSDSSNKLIAREFHLSEATVKAHVKSILRNLQSANRTQVAIRASCARTDQLVLEAGQIVHSRRGAGYLAACHLTAARPGDVLRILIERDAHRALGRLPVHIDPARGARRIIVPIAGDADGRTLLLWAGQRLVIASAGDLLTVDLALCLWIGNEQRGDAIARLLRRYPVPLALRLALIIRSRKADAPVRRWSPPSK